MTVSAAQQEQIDLAIAHLRAGGLVGLPTETVYGLAADADNPEAVRSIFALKGRPADHPVIVHIAGVAQLADWAQNIPDAAFKLAGAFWPGPLTLILQRQPHVPDAVTGGQDTVGIRAPSHPLAHALLKQFGGGIAAPSANRFGHVSPTTAQHVRDEFGDDLSLVLEGGPCDIGVESTIVGLTGEQPTLLRPGGVPREAIEALLGMPLIHHQKSDTAKVRVSGLLDSHYSPRTPLVTGAAKVVDDQAYLAFERGQRVVLVTCGGRDIPICGIDVLNLPADPQTYAQQIYDTLRQLDRKSYHTIFLELPPHTAPWLAVQDRLHRAAHTRLG
ncbi:L-threonylcarbamoyladenylate synthase [Silvimonas terrae]|uniref:Threonylcarbamoyl-AMP synthase n=1 Tax=Silvimonas terrae TaxID=300266 RepID=A0A840RBV0_9NEIS|nr:L-threonylcarbamoyladenylate synthase [Silvimonas terrae]MBB5189771.1 L-threonylcarbamoyladenylate synthase [Silvimonas terrae]